MIGNQIYYHLKPYLPWRLRMALRRTLAYRKRESCKNVWPINETAGRPPEGWSGWPDGKKFALVLTHDVESPEGLAKCQRLMRLEKNLGFRSSFNFIPEGPYRVSKKLREILASDGFEVGIHDFHHDGSLYRSRGAFSARAKKINDYLKEWGAVGFRSGFMFHNLEWQHELMVDYDASTFDTDPFEPQNDEAGTIFPFWVPRPTNANGASSNGETFSHDAREGYVELPYTLPQDSTLFLLFGEQTPEIWFQKLDWVASRGGMALVNVHPDYLAFDKKNGSPRHFSSTIYEEFLNHVKEKYAGQYWHALPKEIARWYADTVRTKNKSRKKSISNFPVAPEISEKLNWPSLKGRRAAVVLYSDFPFDPRPRRAAEALADAGMEVDLICLREKDSEAKRETINGINVLRLPMQRRRESKINYLLLYSAFLAGCTAILTGRTFKKKYDLVHAHNMPDFLVFSGLTPKLSGAKLILDLHDPMPELMMSIYGLPENHAFVRWLKRLERWSIRFADLILTPNIAFRELFISRGCPPGKIRIVMNSPQNNVFNPARFGAEKNSNSRNGEFRLMYHGFLVKRHGLDMAVEAVSELRSIIPEIKFDIYGSRTSYVERIESQIEKLGLKNQVCYHGQKSSEEIARAIGGVDLGVIPNRRTPFTEVNFPTRIFEYLAMGKPVIVPETRGIRDYFDKTQMLFFNPDDSADLARVIKWVAEHPDETATIVERGREAYRRHLWDEEKIRFLDSVSAMFENRKNLQIEK
jgi:glycosyltransferase involved in cell wall biosynthesis